MDKREKMARLIEDAANLCRQEDGYLGNEFSDEEFANALMIFVTIFGNKASYYIKRKTKTKDDYDELTEESAFLLKQFVESCTGLSVSEVEKNYLKSHK